MKCLRLIFFLLLAWVYLSPHNAFAHCGNGDANACPLPDKDNDDFATNGSGRLAGIDCNDNDWQDYPTISNGSGCSAGQVHTCQSSGAYTSCIALSAFTAKSGSGADYWISPSGVTTSGCGAFGNPCDWRCFVNGALACYHAPAPGDALILRGGTYATTWLDGSTTRMFYVYGHSGTALNPINAMSAPGETARLASPGVSPTEIPPFSIENSNRWIITGLEADGGYANAGITVENSTDVEIRNNKIHDINGNAGSNNLSGIKFIGGSDRIYVHHNLMYDNYDRASTTNQNNVNGVTGFNSDAIRVNNNVSYTTVVGGAGFGMKIKHGFVGGTGSEMINNLIYNFFQPCIGNAQPGINISGNRLIDCNLQNSGSSIQDIDLGGPVDFSNVEVHHNLIVNASAVEFNPETTYAAIGASALNYHHNIVIDNKASYIGDGSNGFVRICNYCSDALYTNVVTGGKLAFDNNCYYNTLSTGLLFDLFSNTGSGSLGQNYIGLPAWKAAGFGYDPSSFTQNPLLDADEIATSTNCSDKGWRVVPPNAVFGFPNDRLTRGLR